MFLILTFAVLALGILSGICYLMLRLAIMLASSLQTFQLTIEQNRSKQLNKWTWAMSFVCAGLIMYFFIFTNPAKNYKTAYINTIEQGYNIKLKGRRSLMVHDPVSLLLRKTYDIEFILKVPRNTGVIEANEIIEGSGEYYQSGSIRIDNDEMKIELYDDSQKPLFWNGEYELMKTN